MEINFDKGFISKLIETGDMSIVKDMQIKPFFINDTTTKEAFKFIQSHFSDTGSVPTERVLLKRFPQLKLEKYRINAEDEESPRVVGNKETLRYWCTELRKRARHNTLVDTIEEAAGYLDLLNTDEALKLIKKSILKVETEIDESTMVDITSDTESRKEEYRKRKENKGMIGIPTGIKTLDFLIKGLQKKQLITLLASSGVGKTWVEIIIGAHAMTNGYSVLQITTEMAEEQMRDRYEAVLYGMLKGGFNYGRFKAGTLLEDEENGYFDFLDNVLPTLPPLYIEGGESPSKVLARAQSLEVDLVLVDGVYLLQDDNNAEQDWLRVANITRDMKRGAKSLEIPIFINTQADSTTSKKTGPELDNIAFAKSIGHESDVVIGLFRDEQMREDKEAMLKILKQREGILGKVYLNWDFTVMNFSCIYGLTESGDQITDPTTASDTSMSKNTYKLKE